MGDLAELQPCGYIDNAPQCHHLCTRRLMIYLFSPSYNRYCAEKVMTPLQKPVYRDAPGFECIRARSTWSYCDSNPVIEATVNRDTKQCAG
mmetsp:Transcript_5348/g.19979  ORF Transcript_5348/g.19979 Transcript_5348/m.19979 type:complete len:91 (-) Transcript_5348:935-1207(-)